MTVFKYKARSSEGKLVEGIKETNTAEHLASFLDRNGLILVSIEELESNEQKNPVFLKRSISRKDIAIFCRQMATMLKAGVTILTSIESIRGMTTKPALKKVLTSMSQKISNGESLSKTMAQYPKVFSNVFTSMVRVGEKGGHLEKVFEDMADYMEKVNNLRRDIKTASMYPIFVLGFMIFVFAGVMLFLIPALSNLFASFGAELPRPTQIAIGISDFFVGNIILILLFIALLVFGIYLIYRTERGRYNIDKMIISVPIFGDFVAKVILAQFFHTFGSLLDNGVPILESLDIAKKVVNNAPYRRSIELMKEEVTQGASLSEALKEAPLFTSMATTMITIGEQAGNVPDMLEKIYEYYTKEVVAIVEGLSSIIEPVLIVILGVMVGAFVIVMYLPIFQMAGQMMGGM